MVCVGTMWQPEVASRYFQCWLWKTTVGEAYDTTLFLIFAAYWLMFGALWFWNEGGKGSE